MKEIKIVCSFYRYVEIKNPLGLQVQLLDLCKRLRLKGRILIGKEGVNGCVFGAKGNVGSFQQTLMQNSLFSGIEFKEQAAEKAAYRKIFVRIRDEIVNSGLNVNLRNKARYISPRELKEMFDRNDEFALVDVRNCYETKIGKFKGAVMLDIKNFRDFPDAIYKIEQLKNKKIVTYCTGGIRCEKASAFLRENGFQDVYQLKGGILKYGEEFPDTYWEGKCFVFDDRLAIDINKKNIEPLNECVWCNKKYNDYINCHNLDCDKLFICCEDCKELHNKSCSEECSNSPKRRKEIIILEQ